MPNSAQTKLCKALFRELPYNGQNIRQCHGSFNNLMPIENLPSKKYLDRLPSLNDIDLFSLNADKVNNSDLEYSSIRPVRCKYSLHSFSLLTNKLNKQKFRSQLTLFHNNVCSLKSNLENLQTHLLNELNFHFNIIGVTETRITNSNSIDFNPNITGYNFEYVPTPLSAGGVGMYIDSDFKYEVLERTSNEAFQALWVEIHFTNAANIVCGVIYRQHNSPETFLKYFEETIENLSFSGKPIYITSDTNLNLLHFNSCNYVQDFLFTLQSLNLTPTIDKPTRVYRNSATLIDNIFTNKVEENIISGNLITDVSDHFKQFCISQSPISKGKPARKLSRDFSNFSDRDFINDLLLIKWDHSVPDNETNVNKLFSSFYNKLNKIVNKHAPIKSISRRKVKSRGLQLEFVNLFRLKINFSRRVILLHINYTEIKS